MIQCSSDISEPKYITKMQMCIEIYAHLDPDVGNSSHPGNVAMLFPSLNVEVDPPGLCLFGCWFALQGPSPIARDGGHCRHYRCVVVWCSLLIGSDRRITTQFVTHAVIQPRRAHQQRGSLDLQASTIFLLLLFFLLLLLWSLLLLLLFCLLFSFSSLFRNGLQNIVNKPVSCQQNNLSEGFEMPDISCSDQSRGAPSSSIRSCRGILVWCSTISIGVFFDGEMWRSESMEHGQVN